MKWRVTRPIKRQANWRIKRSGIVVSSLLLVAVGCATVKVQPTESLLAERASRCLPASGAPDEAALHASAEHALELFDVTLATLGNEVPETRRQLANLIEFPIQRFPRLTTPYITDPEPLESNGRRHTPAWFVPLILDREQLGEIDEEHLAGELTFWLVPHGKDVDEAPWLEVTDCLVREPSSPGEVVSLIRKRNRESRVPDEVSRALEQQESRVPERISRILVPHEEIRGLVFEIPTRTVGSRDSVEPDFYDLKVLPVLNVLREVSVESPAVAPLKRALQAGDWPAARVAVANLEPEHLSNPAAAADLRHIAEAIEPSPSSWSVIEHPSRNFEADLRGLRKAITALAEKLEEQDSDAAVRVRLLQLSAKLHKVLESRRSLAPVALEDPDEDRGRCGGRACVRIAVAGDFQYHGDSSAVLRFLGALDPTILQGAGDDPGSASPLASPESARDVDFVLFAGDLADAAAGSAKQDLFLNVLGVLPVVSPYIADGGGEMIILQSHLARFRKPFFAVPGNHDGYAGFGGLLNVPFDALGWLVESTLGKASPRLGRTWGGRIKFLNEFIPSLVGWRLLTPYPRWDGLGEYQNALGSLNLAFKFRGHSFIGLNSYDLKQRERASVGGVVLYYGGGLQPRSVDWVEHMLNTFEPDEKHAQVLFMHHDPRAATPGKSSYRQQNYGRYDAIDTPVSMITMGHAGFGNSPTTGLYLPLISWLGTAAALSFDVGFGADTGSSHQVWMRRPDWGLSKFPKTSHPRFYDWNSYNARGLIEVINCNLAGRDRALMPTSKDSEDRCKDPKGSLSQILFAHDNIPVDDYWADPNERGAVFRQPDDAQPWRKPGWENSLNSQFMTGVIGAKTRNGSPPAWAQQMRLDTDQGNADVLRMDDVGDIGYAGNYHGFHVLTLYENGDRETEWVPLPR